MAPHQDEPSSGPPDAGSPNAGPADAGSADAGSPDAGSAESLIAPISELVADFAANEHCATVSWGVVRSGGLLTSGGYTNPEAVGALILPDGGTAQPGPDTRYRIASMTKSFSAAATLLLRDDGVLRLDDKIADWAPELAAVKYPRVDAPPITIRDLLTMQSGLVTDDPWADRHLDLSPAAFDAIVADPMVFAQPTGLGYEYTNFGFALLGRVIERATGRSIQDHITERLFGPLGMTSSGWHQPDTDDENVVAGGTVAWMRPLRWYTDAGFQPELPPVADGMIAPMGGIWSTVGDVARWVAFLDDAFPSREEPDSDAVSRASRREMQTPHTLVGRGVLRGITHTMSYGMGLRILDEDVPGRPAPRRVVNHSGGFPGYGSNMRWIPGHRLGVVALSNTTYAPMTKLTALILDVAIEALNEPRPVTSEVPYAEDLTGLAWRLVAQLNDANDPTVADVWNAQRTEALFADNVEPDLDWRRRADAAARVTPMHVVEVRIVNSGHLRIECDTCTITALVAPPFPLRIQSYQITGH